MQQQQKKIENRKQETNAIFAQKTIQEGGNKNSHLHGWPDEHQHNFLFFLCFSIHCSRSCSFQFTLFPISSACRILSLIPWCSNAKNSVFKTIHNVIPSSKSGSLTICYAKRNNRTKRKRKYKANTMNKCNSTSFTLGTDCRSSALQKCYFQTYIYQRHHSHTLYKQFWNWSHPS